MISFPPLIQWAGKVFDRQLTRLPERSCKMRNWNVWLKAAGIRAAKTFAQTTVALLPASAMITEVDWIVVLGTAALAAVASLLTSLAGIPEEEL